MALPERGPNEGWAFNADWPHPVAQTTLPTYQNHAPSNMVDVFGGDFFWSSRAPVARDWVGVDLGTQRPIKRIGIVMGWGERPNDYIHQGTLETSPDGVHWTAVASYTDQREIHATANAVGRYVRLRATASQGWWVAVDNFQVWS